MLTTHNSYYKLHLKLKNLSKTISFQNIDLTKNKEDKVEYLYHLMREVVETACITADDILDDIGKLLTVMESPCLMMAPGLSPLLASHYNLCLGTIISLAGENRLQLKEYLDDLENLKSKGIYMVTELDRGNNAMSLQTQAHFDEECQQFIINTPMPGAGKYMPYLSSDHQPKLAVVMARLWLKEKDCGVHPFIVRCRDENGKLLPNIKVSKLSAIDMYSISEVDHSLTCFQNVRIPHHAFLGGDLNQVTMDGHFITKATNQRDIFFHSLCRVEWGKIVLVAALMPHFKMAIAVATEYSKKRMMNSRENNLKLLDIRSQKFELANAYISLIASISLYEETKLTCLLEKLTHEQLQLNAAVVKTMCVEIARGALHTCMARTGAQGKMIRNRIISAIIINDHTSTAEGDSLPVMMKMAKDLINKDNICEPMDNSTQILPITSQPRLMQLLIHQIHILKQRLCEQLETGVDKNQAWNDSTLLAKEFAWVYGIYRTAITLKHRPDIKRSFCMQHIITNAAWFSANQLISSSDFKQLIESHEKYCINIFDKYTIHSAEEFDITDLIKMTPIGSENMALNWVELSELSYQN